MQWLKDNARWFGLIGTILTAIAGVAAYLPPA